MQSASTESKQIRDGSQSTSAFESEFLRDVLDGLQAPSKSIPCKYLYDERGSQLFDAICELDEYYPTRTETQIMLEHADAIGECIHGVTALVEYGSGSSLKTRVLLDHLDTPHAYLPVDISEEHLLSTAAQLQAEYPQLDVHPIVADFTAGFDLPPDVNDDVVCVYFPGSTIGNLEPEAAVRLLQAMARQCGARGSVLIGFDLHKAKHVLELAYDDPHGVTADFSLNILQRMNRELDANFDVEQFKHTSFYNQELQRIEIYIESLCAQEVTLAGETIEFAAGEKIHTEYSHKYTVAGFARLAARAGLEQTAVWTDADDYFAVMHLRLSER
jgi:dimethylhistidine N-methyltransferase